MINKVINRIDFYRKIRFFRYLYLNYFCKNVIRTDKSRIIPYKHAVLDFEPGSKIYLGGGDVEMGCDLMKGSKAETRVRLRRNAVWSNEGGCRISYGATIEVLSGGVLDSQFFTVNTNSVLIAAKKVSLGRDVMIGRNVVIYDSDHHAIWDAAGETVNPDAPVAIGDHVWLATNSTVLKGTTIGSNSVIGTNSVAHGNIPADSLCRSGEIRSNYGAWKREHP